jgi:hypothetical protein
MKSHEQITQYNNPRKNKYIDIFVYVCIIKHVGKDS